MLVRKRIVLKNRRRPSTRHCCGLSVKDALQFVSSLILPLMLGVFTVVITFQQQKLAQEQRTEDMVVARQQRLEDRNESRLQRELDWDIAQSAKATQNKAVNDQYEDGVLLAYINEMGDLLEKKEGRLTSDPLIHTLARVKTLNALRQLDGSRQLHIISFLHEAKQITDANQSLVLDLSEAKLADIDFRSFSIVQEIVKLSLNGIYLINSTATNTHLREVSFSSALLSNINFTFATLNKVYFLSSTLHDVDFSSTTSLSDVGFSSAKLQNVDFSSSILDAIDFSSTEFYNVDFSSARLRDVNFSSAVFDIANFPSTAIDVVDFSFATLPNANFASARLNKVDFSSLHSVPETFRFNYAKLFDTIFDSCSFRELDFSYANIKNCSFRGVTLSNANFFLANLENVDFTNATMTDDQLRSAVSIRNVKLPNGTIEQGRNFIENGDAKCNVLLANHWQIESGNIAIVPRRDDQNECRFSLQSIAIGAMMSQEVILPDIGSTSYWIPKNVQLQAQMSNGVSIELVGKNRNNSIDDKHIANSTHNKISMAWLDSMKNLQIVVKFNAQMNTIGTDDTWCDRIELFIGYDA